MKGKLNEVFAFLTDAYKTLSGPEERAKYDKHLSDRRQADFHAKKNNKELARLRFQEGLSALKKGLYNDAAEILGQAVYLNSTVADYHFTLGMVYTKQKKLREAEKEINLALKIEPSNPEYNAELGHVYLGLGLKLRAKSSFEKAIISAPSNKRAIEGLAKVKEKD
jgi:Tfp pilus assembly protein PilF